MSWRRLVDSGVGRGGGRGCYFRLSIRYKSSYDLCILQAASTAAKSLFTVAYASVAVREMERRVRKVQGVGRAVRGCSACLAGGQLCCLVDSFS